MEDLSQCPSLMIVIFSPFRYGWGAAVFPFNVEVKKMYLYARHAACNKSSVFYGPMPDEIRPCETE